MKRVVVICPEIAGPYAERAMAHARAKGDAPILVDEGCFAWLPVAHLLAVYVDQGISTPMTEAVNCARSIGLQVEHRVLNADAWAAMIRRTAFPEKENAECSTPPSAP